MTRALATEFPLQRATFVSIVTERMRNSIGDGTFAPGMERSEVELANRFGVSRGPGWWAIQRRLREGYLRSEPHRGVLVPVLADEDVVDVCVARSAVDSTALKILIGIRRPGAVGTLGRYGDDRESAAARGAGKGVGRFNLEFHSALVSLSLSDSVQRMFSTLISETRLCVAALAGSGAEQPLISKHWIICQAVREGDIERSLAALDTPYDDAAMALTSTRHDGDRRGLRREDEAT